MPPKKGPKLHELAAEVKIGYKIVDSKKKTYIVGKQFATGGFGRIHTCHEENTPKTELVMKIEPADNGPLFSEVIVFQKILKLEQIEAYKKRMKLQWLGLPYIISAGIFTYTNQQKMRFMILPKYATSLENIREKQKTLALRNVLEIARSMLNSLEYVQEMDYTHADLKAANILLEKLGDFQKTVLVDFGLARFSGKIEDKPEKKRAHNGTCLFTSCDAHRGCNPSFRADVEILAWNLVYWLTGTLPWLQLETNPEKTFEEKRKFIAGLPATLKSALKSTPEGEASPAFDFILTLLNCSAKTGYAEKVDYSKLRKSLEVAVGKLMKEAKKSTSASSTSASASSSSASASSATPRRGTRKQPPPPPPESSEDSEDQENSPQKSTPTPPKRTRKTPKSTTKNNTSFLSGNESILSGSPSISRQNNRSATISAAKKIEKKYRRKSQVVTSSPIKNQHAMRTRSGITAAMKASPTQLRSVPGMLNFPRGRRTIFIKETAAKFKQQQEEEEVEE
ncbi:unnamed protein product [Caenorhabditis angaria]|uniref:non-specific serine/threonine protein kinase n=1 Tax=Caenorhabditis angaria TaxID=860376 RepID=A0A9P1MYR5_9PELO|nr:unnamed protein product [Caenorhabditis angaria]